MENRSFMAQWVYTDTVKDHFMNPRNIWDEKDDFKADGVGEVGSLACGDQMRVGIRVEDGRIADLRWLTYGCASAIASTSMMSEMAKGMTLEEAYHLTPQMITEALRIICECKGVSDVQIEELVKSGKALTFDELSAQTGCSTACGKCRGRIIEALEEYRHIYGK